MRRSAPEAEAMRLGTLVHRAVLEPDDGTEVDVEVVAPIEITVRQYGDNERDAETCADKLGTWWWIVNAYACSTGRGVLATPEDARADAIEHLRELRERIDLTLRHLESATSSGGSA